MADKNILDIIMQKVAEFSPHLQRQVLSYVESLQAMPRGVPGKDLMPLAGSLSDADAAVILKAVKMDCEQIDDDSIGEPGCSPLDVPGIDINITAAEIVEIVRQGRERPR